MDFIKKTLDSINKLYKYFDCDNDRYGIDNCTNCYWKLVHEDVYYCENKEEIVNDTGNYYSSVVLNKYKKEGYTLIIGDTGQGYKLAHVFDNSKILEESNG